jgi:toxin ParE1/3/4
VPAHYSSRAEEDLQEIWARIAEHSLVSADKVMAQIMECCDLLDSSPRIGERCEQYAPGLRRFTVGWYVIFYLETDVGIQVARILHGARDIDSILGGS